jgi:hypothetical protein
MRANGPILDSNLHCHDFVRVPRRTEHEAVWRLALHRLTNMAGVLISSCDRHNRYGNIHLDRAIVADSSLAETETPPPSILATSILVSGWLSFCISADYVHTYSSRLRVFFRGPFESWKWDWTVTITFSLFFLGTILALRLLGYRLSGYDRADLIGPRETESKSPFD